LDGAVEEIFSPAESVTGLSHGARALRNAYFHPLTRAREKVICVQRDDGTSVQQVRLTTGDSILFFEAKCTRPAGKLQLI